MVVSAPDYSNSDNVIKPSVRFLGVSSTVNHTANTQMDGFGEIYSNMVSSYNNSPLARRSGLELSEDYFWASNNGYCADHSEDQNRLSRLSAKRKSISTRIILGQRKLAEMPDCTRDTIISSALNVHITSSGGADVWQSLSEDERTQQHQALIRSLQFTLGHQIYPTLPRSEQARLDLYVRVGCQSHKELNAFKGFCSGLSRFWSDNRLDGPLKLMNKDNAAAAGSGQSYAADRAVAISQGGIVKLTSLAGALFAHKDKKKGLQDSYKVYFEKAVGFSIPFPGTSSTRYQSYYRAAAVLISYRPYFLDLLDVTAFKKESAKLNHLEQNVKNGLLDISTLEEMCVAVLYSQSVAVPYIRTIRRRSFEGINALDAGPLHRSLLTFIRKLIDKPELVVSSDASWVHGAFDAQPWEDAKAVYAVHATAQELDMRNLRGLFMSGLVSALETWTRFSSEFIEGILNSLYKNVKFIELNRWTN